MSASGRYTPLPPIGAVSLKSCHDSSGKATGHRLFELHRRMTQLSLADDFSSSEVGEHIEFCSEAIGDSVSQVLVLKRLVELNFTEVTQHLLEVNFEGDDQAASNLLQALALIVSGTNYSSELRLRVLEIGLHIDILRRLDDDRWKEVKDMSDMQAAGLLFNLLGVLYNVVQFVVDARYLYRDCDAMRILQRHRSSPLATVACLALLIQVYIINQDDENDRRLLQSAGEQTFQFLVGELRQSIVSNGHQAGSGFNTRELVTALNKLGVDDANKQRIVAAGALPQYAAVLGATCDDDEYAAAAQGLWTLAFTCADAIRADPGCVKALEQLVKTTKNDNVRLQAQGALSALQPERPKTASKAGTDGTDSAGGEGHIFLSYQWENKPTVLKIRDRLRTAGYKVWIDDDDMSGSVLDAMAEAVEKAAVVVVCTSQKYYESPNCKTEAMYAFRVKKPVLPMRMQPRFIPNGWLGMLIGSQLVFDFSADDKFEDSLRRAMKELGNRGKNTSSGAKE